jgi:hypothetical protein
VLFAVVFNFVDNAMKQIQVFVKFQLVHGLVVTNLLVKTPKAASLAIVVELAEMLRNAQNVRARVVKNLLVKILMAVFIAIVVEPAEMHPDANFLAVVQTLTAKSLQVLLPFLIESTLLVLCSFFYKNIIKFKNKNTKTQKHKKTKIQKTQKNKNIFFLIIITIIYC